MSFSVYRSHRKSLFYGAVPFMLIFTFLHLLATSGVLFKPNKKRFTVVPFAPICFANLSFINDMWEPPSSKAKVFLELNGPVIITGIILKKTLPDDG